MITSNVVQYRMINLKPHNKTEQTKRTSLSVSDGMIVIPQNKNTAKQCVNYIDFLLPLKMFGWLFDVWCQCNTWVLIVSLTRELPDPVTAKLLGKLECRPTEAIHYDVFKTGVRACVVLQGVHELMTHFNLSFLSTWLIFNVLKSLEFCLTKASHYDVFKTGLQTCVVLHCVWVFSHSSLCGLIDVFDIVFTKRIY